MAMEGELFSSIDPGMAIIAAVALIFNFLNYLKFDTITADKVAAEISGKDIVQWVSTSFKNLAELMSQCAILVSFVSLVSAIIGQVTWSFVFVSFAGSILLSVSMRKFYHRAVENAQMAKLIVK